MSTPSTAFDLIDRIVAEADTVLRTFEARTK